jgi:hypothetical protein
MGKDKYSWNPCSKQFRSAAFHTESIFSFIYKITHINEENNITEHSPSVRVPCPNLTLTSPGLAHVHLPDIYPISFPGPDDIKLFTSVIYVLS